MANNKKSILLKWILEEIELCPSIKAIDIRKRISIKHKANISSSYFNSIIWKEKTLLDELVYNEKEKTYRIKNDSNNVINKQCSNNTIDIEKISKIIHEERVRIGKPEATLLAENIIFRLNQLQHEST